MSASAVAFLGSDFGKGCCSKSLGSVVDSRRVRMHWCFSQDVGQGFRIRVEAKKKVITTDHAYPMHQVHGLHAIRNTESLNA